MKKVFITGVSGSGKTTLSRKISKKFNLPVLDLDDIFWKKRYTEKRSDDECASKLQKFISSHNGWVIEGVFDWGKSASDSADIVIWLKPPLWLAIWRLVKRWLFDWERKKKETLRELLENIRYVLDYRVIRPGRPYSTEDEHKLLISGNEEKLVEVHSLKDINSLLARRLNKF